MIVIVGAGPAGTMLAYQLASNGIPVRVLERHQDFRREFRGELAMPSVLGALEQLGVLQQLVKTRSAIQGVERQLFVGLTRCVVVPEGRQIGAGSRNPPSCSFCTLISLPSNPPAPHNARFAV